MNDKVTNTKRDDNHPEWTLGGDPRSIERQEARGQEELVNADVLPAKIYGDKTILEAAGVVFGNPVDDDPLFLHVTFPAGWRKRATDHSMWTELLDEKEIVRAMIFYKAAFYDRKAHLHIK